MADMGEKIWQLSFTGLRQGLTEADEMEWNGRHFDARVKRASVCYSYWLYGQARAEVSVAAIMAESGLYRVSADQCDVIGTLLLHLCGEVERSEMFFRSGLEKEPTAHGKALLHIGLAEAAAIRKDNVRCLVEMSAAVGLIGEVRREQNQAQAMRQFGRVLRRAAVLFVKMGRLYAARDYFAEAWKIATHPEWGSRSQRLKIRFARLKWLLIW